MFTLRSNEGPGNTLESQRRLSRTSGPLWARQSTVFKWVEIPILELIRFPSQKAEPQVTNKTVSGWLVGPTGWRRQWSEPSLGPGRPDHFSLARMSD